jgi:hypothetical protein
LTNLIENLVQSDEETSNINEAVVAQINKYELYPSDNLYPANDLLPNLEIIEVTIV